MLPPRITRSGLLAMAFHPDVILLPHHGLSHDAVNCPG